MASFDGTSIWGTSGENPFERGIDQIEEAVVLGRSWAPSRCTLPDEEDRKSARAAKIEDEPDILRRLKAMRSRDEVREERSKREKRHITSLEAIAREQLSQHRRQRKHNRLDYKKATEKRLKAAKADDASTFAFPRMKRELDLELDQAKRWTRFHLQTREAAVRDHKVWKERKEEEDKKSKGPSEEGGECAVRLSSRLLRRRSGECTMPWEIPPRRFFLSVSTSSIRPAIYVALSPTRGSTTRPSTCT